MASAKPTGAAIRDDEVYTISDFMLRTGLGVKSIRKAQREGLEVRRVGRRSYVAGKSWSEYLGKTATV